MTCLTRLAGVCAVVMLLGSVLSPSVPLAAHPVDRSASPTNTHLRSPQTFFAYLEPRDNLDVSLVKADDISGSLVQDLTVTVRSAAGGTISCTVADVGSEGSTCAWTNLTSPVAGIWAIDLTMSSCPSSGICGRDRFDWDITVQRGSTDVPGRVWSEMFAMNQNPSSPAVDLSFWYQSQFGYTYLATYREYHGIDSTFAADNFGVVFDGTCTPAYQSSATLHPAAGTCGGTFKVFFEPPAADLPATAVRWDGATDWVRPPLPATPAITGGTFTSPSGSRAGTLTFDLSGYSGPLAVHVDVNDDGDHVDPVDRTIAVTADEGPVAVAFDGLDGGGSPIPVGQSLSFDIVVDRVAEIHFINSDVELRGGGIEVIRLNGPPSGRRTLHWNDTAFPKPDPDRCSTTPVADGRSGVDSTAGVHGWDLGTCGSVGGANSNNGVNGAWGDVRVVDDWAYVPVSVTHDVRLPGHDIEITKTASTPTARPGDLVTYTITVRNTGEHPHTLTDPVSLTDDLSGVLDDAAVETAPAADSGTASYTAPVVSWSGPLAPGQKATITYSIRVGEPDTGDKKLVNTVVSDTPGANCGEITEDSACSTVVHVPSLKIVKTADRTEFKPGDTVLYTLTVTNDGQVPFTTGDPASFSDDLTGVLDDAEFDPDDVTASTGATGFASPVLTWTGPLGVGQSASVIYPVTVNDPDLGDGTLRNTVVGPPGAAVTCAVCEVELGSSVVGVSKEVVSRTPNPDGSFTLVYDVTVRGAGSAPSTYDLNDELRFGAGVTVLATSAVDVSGTTIVAGWDGTGETSVVTGVSIAPGVSHVYRMTVTATPGSTTTGAATDCALDAGETGTGFRNTATVTGSGGSGTAEACVPIPRLKLTKVVQPGSPKPNGDGTYTVVYRIDVVNAGAARVTYDLSDELGYGSGLSVESAQAENTAPGSVVADPNWDGENSTTVASDVDVEPGDTHTYLATVRTKVDPASPGTATDCALTDGESGTGFLGTAKVVGNDQILRADACVEAPQIVIDKQAIGAPDAGNDGSYTQIYDIIVTNDGAGATTYDLTDELRFGAGVTVESAGVVNTAPGSVPMSPSWNGLTDAVLASDVAIDGGAAHTYRVTVVVSPDPDVTTGIAADCVLDPGETGTGFRNTATVSQNGRSRQSVACTAPPVISVTKTVTAVVPNDDGTYTVTYEIAVVNDGAGSGNYDLSDSLRPGADVQVVSAGVVNPPAAGPGTGWDGASDPFVAANVTIEGNSTHVFTMTVVARPPDDPAPGALDCELDAGESGTGAWNSATVMSNGVVDVATACAAFPDLSLSHVVQQGSPKPNGDGTYTVVYEIVVENSGAAPTTYDLTQELLPGNGISVVSATSTSNPAWNGGSEQEIVTGAGIGARERDTHLLTVVYVVDPVNAVSATTDCETADDEKGTGYLGRAVVTSNGVARTASACAGASLLSLTQTMTEPVKPNGDGSYAVVYEIEVTNLGAGAGVYDLTDHLRFGTGVQIGTATASAVDDGPVPDGEWDGSGVLVAGAEIAGGDTHVYRVTAIVSSEAVGAATDCVVDQGESGTGLRGLATMTTNGLTQEAAACGEIASVSIAKDVVGTTARGDGSYEISYQITVANDGAAPATYSLHDTLRYGSGTTVGSATIEEASGWDGGLNPVVRADVPLAPGEQHVYPVRVVATPPVSTRAESFDCVLDADEEGTGALNTAAVVVNGISKSASSCAPFPGVMITKVVLPGSPRVEDNGDVVVDYRITVVNNGAAATAYDLDDRFRFGAGTAVSAATVRMSPDVAPTNLGWNGRSDLRIASDVHLAAGAGHTFVVTARVATADVAAEAATCAPDSGEDDSGLRNEATATANGVTLTTDACVPIPADGLAATGIDVRSLTGLGLGLLAAGLLLTFAARRRTR